MRFAFFRLCRKKAWEFPLWVNSSQFPVKPKSFRRRYRRRGGLLPLAKIQRIFALGEKPLVFLHTFSPLPGVFGLPKTPSRIRLTPDSWGLLRPKAVYFLLRCLSKGLFSPFARVLPGIMPCGARTFLKGHRMTETETVPDFIAAPCGSLVHRYKTSFMENPPKADSP